MHGELFGLIKNGRKVYLGKWADLTVQGLTLRSGSATILEYNPRSQLWEETKERLFPRGFVGWTMNNGSDE